MSLPRETQDAIARITETAEALVTALVHKGFYRAEAVGIASGILGQSVYVNNNVQLLPTGEPEVRH